MPARHPGNACAVSCTTPQKGAVCSSVALGCCRGAGAGRGERSVARRRSRHSECVLKRARCTSRPALRDSGSMLTCRRTCICICTSTWCTSTAKALWKGDPVLATVLLSRKRGEGQCPGRIPLSDTTFLSHAVFCWAWLFLAANPCKMTSAVSIPGTDYRGCM